MSKDKVKDEWTNSMSGCKLCSASSDQDWLEPMVLAWTVLILLRVQHWKTPDTREAQLLTTRFLQLKEGRQLYIELKHSVLHVIRKL